MQCNEVPPKESLNKLLSGKDDWVNESLAIVSKDISYNHCIIIMCKLRYRILSCPFSSLLGILYPDISGLLIAKPKDFNLT